MKKSPKQPTSALPAGLRASTRKLSPALRKLLMEDRAIASGGTNLARRQTTRTR